jgi:signal transduction histidine kinase
MRSAKLAVSLVCLVTTGIGIGIAIGFAWCWLQQTGENPVQRAEFLPFSLAACATALLAVVVAIWAVKNRPNHSVAHLAHLLEGQRVSKCEFQALSSSGLNRDHQKLVSEINALINAVTETQSRLNHYSAKVAHELRAPLTLLQLHLDFVAKELDPRFVEVMTTQIRRLTEYVDTALYIARVADHKIRPDKSRRKIADVVREIAEFYKLQAARQQRKLAVDLLTDQEADLDEKIFGLILHNLLSNAIAHGTGEIRLRLHAGDGTATLLVLNRVRTKTYTEAGTGIGLQTVAVLAQAHNLGFRSRRIFNNYVAVMRIATLAPVGETVPKSQSKLSV